MATELPFCPVCPALLPIATDEAPWVICPAFKPIAIDNPWPVLPALNPMAIAELP
jgi:hypothetical protein